MQIPTDTHPRESPPFLGGLQIPEVYYTYSFPFKPIMSNANYLSKQMIFEPYQYMGWLY